MAREGAAEIESHTSGDIREGVHVHQPAQLAGNQTLIPAPG